MPWAVKPYLKTKGKQQLISQVKPLGEAVPRHLPSQSSVKEAVSEDIHVVHTQILSGTPPAT